MTTHDEPDLVTAPRALALLAALALLGLAAPAGLRAADGDLDATFGGYGVVTLPFDLGAFKSDLGTSVVELTMVVHDAGLVPAP